MTKIGTFEITSGEVYVTDPCYEIGTWCQGLVKDVLNGTWESYVEYGTSGWEKGRVKALTVKHITEGNKHNVSDKADFEVGVDSGTAGFFDAAKYPGKEDDFYDRVCNLTFTDAHGGCIEFGTISSSGFGDGGYDCWVGKNSDGKVVNMEIIFIDDNEEDCGDDDEEEDECA